MAFCIDHLNKYNIHVITRAYPTACALAAPTIAGVRNA
jgi:hypothetical protein